MQPMRLRQMVSLLVLLCAGCGQRIHVAPVSGRITDNGQPVAGLHVTFQPLSENGSTTALGPASVGQTNSDGVYQLTTIAGERDGAVVGRHAITIVSVAAAFFDNESQAEPAPVVALPKRFTDGSLRFEVTAEGTSAANFELQSDGN